MRRIASFVCLFVAGALCACSGGGGSSSPTAPQPALTGEGSSAAIDQKISFTIVVPSAATASSKDRRGLPAARRRVEAQSSPTPTPAPPYFSPATGSIVLTLAEINGVTPQVAAPPIPPIPVTCRNCTFTAPNIPAAIGVDRYFVQTYSGYANGQAAGNLISSGFVDVTVPVTANPRLGGVPALSIGGYVAQIALTPGAVNFNEGVPGDQHIYVSALDAAGATIVGSVQYASPIVLSVVDQLNFNVSGAETVSIPATQASPVDLHYGGGLSFGTQVQATSVNEDGVQVSASPVEVNLSEPTSAPTATPTPVPPGHTPTPPTPAPTATARPTPTIPPTRLSLYVADSNTDTVSEYAIVSSIAAGSVPNPIPTPQRVMQFNGPGAVSGSLPLLACQQTSFQPFGSNASSNGTNGVAVASNGTIFTLPNCYDGTNTYIFGFPAASVGSAVPTIIDPVAGSLFGSSGIGNGMALTYQSTLGKIFALFYGNAAGLAGFPATSNGQAPTVAIGQQCYQEFGQPAPCSIDTGSFASGFGEGFGVDSFGFAYIPSYWVDTPIGDASNLINPGAVLAVPASGSSLATVPQSVLTGTNSLVGGNEGPPYATAVDGTTLYALTGSSANEYSDSTPFSYPGLSACPPSSANAPVNPPYYDGNGNQLNTNCEGGGTTNQHEYLVAYPIGLALLGNAASGTDVDLQPEFVLGGDSVGGFGCATGYGGEYIAASAGYVYVLNEYPTCATYAPEIDVYDTNGITSGYHTDIGPVARISLASGFPSAIAIGPTGSVTGGQAALHAAHHGYRSNFYHWRRPVPRKNSWKRRAPVRYPQ